MIEYDPARHIHFGGDVAIGDWHEARKIARMHLPPEAGDAKRIEQDVERVRRALALPSYQEHRIQLNCFNADEANRIMARLTPEEVSRVEFTWIEWPEARR